MDLNEKTKMLLDAQEHPEQFTEDALRQMLDDPEIGELMEATAQGKRAMMRQLAEEDQEAVDAAWQDFSEKVMVNHSMLHKVAASFIGLLLISGIAFAAVHFVRSYRNADGGELNYPTQETRVSGSHQPTIPVDTAEAIRPVVFDNVTLDSILPQIARHYGYAVAFRSDQSKGLRLFLTWNPQDSIQHVTDKLNLFEQINIVLDRQTIIVE